jgi:two-component system cell cycle sensor histidine kinase/response regulator CckA
LAAALGLDQPEEALAQVTALLQEIGVSPVTEGLAGSADVAGAPDADTRALLTSLLGAARVRAAEHDEHRRARERLEMLSSGSFEGILIHVDGVVIDANQRLAEMLGCEIAEVLGPHTLGTCVAPEDLPDVMRRMANRIEGEYVITGVRKDGSRFRAELLSKQGRLGDRPVRVVAVRDVTERERTHALLRESEMRFRVLAEAAFDFTVFSRDGIIVEMSDGFERVTGFKTEEVVGRSMFDFMAPSAIPLTTQMVAERCFGSYEAMGLDARGESVPTQVVVVAATLDGQPVRAAGVRDLRPARRLEAERRALEQQVERAQRLDSLGVLAGGIAHDFNNLLAGVLGNADFLRERVTDPGDRAAAEAIVVAAQRAAALTRQMLAYAGQRDLGRREPVEIGALFREIGALLDATLSKKAQLELTIEPGSVVLGDRATISQVLMNLLTNASDALGDRPGQIQLRARHVHQLDARWDGAQGATVRPGNWVLIEVKDTGVGMDQATRGRVFEPFFSTKEKGHGLGLAACLGIVKAHGGAVLVESEAGRGSCFSILLPAVEAADRAADQTQPRPAPRPCKVLVVDDEALVRSQLRRSLELRGYTVEEATDGTGALAALEAAQPDAVDVVVLDMTMPDIDGAEVLHRLRASGSRVPIIVSSGYLDVAVERRLPRGEFQGFLAKPYGATELVEAIERALAATATSA